MSYSQSILHTLQQDGPQTVRQLSAGLQIPQPHVRAAIAELAFVDRKITCRDGHHIELGQPPELWPKSKPR